MSRANGQRKGGQVTAEKLREKSLNEYYAHPNLCFQCNKVIEVGEQQVAQVRRKRFCNKSCAAQHNNRKCPKHQVFEVIPCQDCGEQIRRTRRPGLNRGYRQRKFCGNCGRLRIHGPGLRDRPKLTKGELFSVRKNWQSASSAIRKEARALYFKSKRPQCCAVCSYTKHVQVCHIRDVADFPDNALIAEINNLANLVALCPTHHWEFGHDEMSLEDRRTVALVIALDLL